MSIFDKMIKDIQRKQAPPDAPANTPVSPAAPVAALSPLRKASPFGDTPRGRRPSEREPMRPMGISSYEEGTDYVPKTGPAILHKGEKVVPANQNQDGDQSIMDPNNPGSAARRRETNAVINADSNTSDPPPANESQKVDKVHPTKVKGEKRISPDDLKKWSKPLGSLAKGTDYVPETGVYKIHEGEKVVPAKDNMADMFEKVPGRKSEEKPKKSIKRIEITKSHNGKHIVKHVHHHPSHEDETHVMNDMAALHSHLEDHAGTPNEGEGAESAPAGAPAQLAASAPAAPGAEPTAVPGV